MLGRHFLLRSSPRIRLVLAGSWLNVSTLSTESF